MYPEKENDRSMRYMLLTKDLKIRPGFEIPMAVLERTHAENAEKRMNESRKRQAHGSCGFVDGMITPPECETSDQEQDQHLDESQQGNTAMASKEHQVQHDEMEGIETAEIDKIGKKQQNENAEMAIQDHQAQQIEVIDVEQQKMDTTGNKQQNMMNAEMGGKNGPLQQDGKAEEEKAEERKKTPKNTKTARAKIEKGHKVQKAKKDAKQKAKKLKDAKQKAKTDAKQKAKKDAKQKAKKDAKQKAKMDAKQKAKKDAKQNGTMQEQQKATVSNKGSSKATEQTEDQIKKKLHSVPWLSYVRLAWIFAIKDLSAAFLSPIKRIALRSIQVLGIKLSRRGCRRQKCPKKPMPHAKSPSTD